MRSRIVSRDAGPIVDDHARLNARAGSDLRASVTWRATRVRNWISRPASHALAERLRGVARDVEHGLDHLLLVASERGQASVVVAPDRSRSGNSAMIRLRTRSSTSWILTRHELRQPVRRQQPVHQRLQAVGFLDDHLRVFVQPGALELAFEQLRGAADAAQRILDLVREIADQLAVGLALVEHALFACRA